MLKLSDFVHLPQLDEAVAHLLDDGPGLIVVAGLDPRPAIAPSVRGQFPPSGRTAIFRVLVNELLAAPGTARAVIVAAEPTMVRFPRSLRRRVTSLPVKPPQSYASRIAEALQRRPDLLVVDRLTAETAAAAAAATQRGVRVVSQLDTVFRGAAVADHLRDLGVPAGQLGSLTWVVWVQRLAALCPACKHPVAADPALLARLYPYAPSGMNTIASHGGSTALAPAPPIFFHAPGCAACAGSGRQGDVAVFDIFRRPADGHDPATHPGLVPLEAYALRLAEQGYLALDDVLHLDTQQLRRTYYLLTASEQALADANATLERRLAELRAANEVLQQRTAALLSLQDIGQALITSTELGDLVVRVCRYARELCGADRAILYLLHPGEMAEVLAVSGWDAALIHQRIDAALLTRPAATDEPVPFHAWPPGIPPRPADIEGAELRAGLWVPLVAEHRQVGLMIVHTTRKARFAPGEVALLQTFANQAALSIQRALLITQLRTTITQLETAQTALVRQERMEREMELARQVQQSVLPKVFPQVAGYTFAAGNRPARQVGGDFYDVIVLDNDHIGIVIADVSDKGMPAALYMALTRSLLLAEARRNLSPRTVLLTVNRLLRELGDPHMFVTIFYGVIGVHTRRLTFARAGHDYPLLLRGEGLLTLEGAGTVLGIFDAGLPLSEEQLDLLSGDRLVLYTDGLTDLLNPHGQRLELEGLISLLQSHIHLSPADLCAAIFDDLATYQGDTEQFDDMTLLVVDVT